MAVNDATEECDSMHFWFQYDEVDLQTREDYVALLPGKVTILNEPRLAWLRLSIEAVRLRKIRRRLVTSRQDEK
jgi:hypothetical protein